MRSESAMKTDAKPAAIRTPPQREIGSVWTASKQRLKVDVDHGAVVIRGIRLATASERDDFSRIYFQACAEADDWAEEATMPP